MSLIRATTNSLTTSPPVLAAAEVPAGRPAVHPGRVHHARLALVGEPHQAVPGGAALHQVEVGRRGRRRRRPVVAAAEVGRHALEPGGDRRAQQLTALLGREVDLQPVVAGPHDVDAVAADVGHVADVVAERVEVLEVAAEHLAAGLVGRVVRGDDLEQHGQGGAAAVLGEGADQPDEPLHRGVLVPARRARHRHASLVWCICGNPHSAARPGLCPTRRAGCGWVEGGRR